MKSPQRSKWRGSGRKILLALLFFLLALTFIFGQRGLSRWNQLRQQCARMQSENDSLQKEIVVLSTRLRALETSDSLELEGAARYWGMVRPGEEIYLIKSEKDTISATP